MTINSVNTSVFCVCFPYPLTCFVPLQFTAQNSANAGFANFDAFGQSSGSSNFGGFPTASQSSFQPQNTGRTPSTFDQYLIEIIPCLFV